MFRVQGGGNNSHKTTIVNFSSSVYSEQTVEVLEIKWVWLDLNATVVGNEVVFRVE